MSNAGANLDDAPSHRPDRRAGGASILGGAVDRADDRRARTCLVEQGSWNVVDVDLHPPVPGRRRIAGQLPDPHIDEAPRRSLAADLVAEEFRPGRDADRK